MSTMDKWGPKYRDIRDPRDPKKKHGMFWNFPRYLYFGGTARPVGLDQAGDRRVTLNATKGQDAIGPISDRGKGR